MLVIFRLGGRMLCNLEMLIGIDTYIYEYINIYRNKKNRKKKKIFFFWIENEGR